jgi:hypothetical protein
MMNHLVVCCWERHGTSRRVYYPINRHKRKGSRRRDILYIYIYKPLEREGQKRVKEQRLQQCR